jgi:hypothetical protein
MFRRSEICASQKGVCGVQRWYKLTLLTMFTCNVQPPDGFDIHFTQKVIWKGMIVVSPFSPIVGRK